MATQKQVSPEMQQRIQRILDEQEKAPNEMVEYLVEQLKQLRSESAMVAERTNQVRGQLQNLETSAQQLQGATNKCFLDMVAWLERKPGPALKVVEKEPEAAPPQA